MKRKTILATMIGLTLTGAIAAGPALAQPVADPHYPGDANISGHHGVSEHDHYAAAVTQQRKLRAQHEREDASEHDHYAASVTQKHKLQAQHERWAEHQQ